MLVNRDLIGHTVHIVPAEGGLWHVADLSGHVSTFGAKAAAIEQAKRIAAASQPSQVVLFDEFGNIVPVARFQLPQYPQPYPDERRGTSPFEAAMKALVIGGFIAAGVTVLGDLVKSVEEMGKDSSNRPRNAARRKTRAAT